MTDKLREGLEVLYQLTYDGHIEKEEFMKLVELAIDNESTQQQPIYVPYPQPTIPINPWTTYQVYSGTTIEQDPNVVHQTRTNEFVERGVKTDTNPQQQTILH